jgi:lichenan operon transcriptional antiterminator
MSFRVTHRKEKLLEEILYSDGYITSQDLANKFKVSPRTIRQDIRQLSAELRGCGIELVAIPSKGYSIQKKDHARVIAFLDSLQPTHDDIPSMPSERSRFIIQQVLLGEGLINLNDLAEELCVSRSTVEKDVRDVRDWLAAHDLELVNKKSQGIYLQGGETAIRYAIVNYFWNFHDLPALSDLEIIKETLGEKYFEPVKGIVYSLHDMEGIHLSDADFLYLLMYLTIAVARMSSHKEIHQDIAEISSITSKKEYALAAAIAEKVEAVFELTFSQAELAQLTNCLLQVNIYLDTNPDVRALRCDEPFNAWVAEMLIEIARRFGVDFSGDGELIHSLAAYLDTLTNRREYKTLVKNPGLDEIIKEYPDALEMAVVVARAFKEKCGIAANEHEIGNIALYLCAAIERQKDNVDRVRKQIVIICATGRGGSQLLAVKVRHNFPEMQIGGVFPAYRLEEALNKKPDLIVSTIPLHDTDCPVVHISQLLNEDDLMHIRQAVDEIQVSEGMLDLVSLFRPALFFPAIASGNSEDVIDHLCGELEKLGLVDDSFAASVHERESIFPTAIGNLVAIPHALTPTHAASWIAVGILNKPVQWGHDFAQLILLLNIDDADKDSFTRIYEKLYEKIKTKKDVEKLLQSTDFENFIKVINE